MVLVDSDNHSSQQLGAAENFWVSANIDPGIRDVLLFTEARIPMAAARDRGLMVSGPIAGKLSQNVEGARNSEERYPLWHVCATGIEQFVSTQFLLTLVAPIESVLSQVSPEGVSNQLEQTLSHAGSEVVATTGSVAAMAEKRDMNASMVASPGGVVIVTGEARFLLQALLIIGGSEEVVGGLDQCLNQI
ncbi:hypothetical protein NE237_007833 [Protea cynaroides]|uniref:Uncharacterized protein n=1 Tax=Protea cynaroides TaxID=273540 RepID=A0A9Q0KQ85_9MAGN|nr:hypothetical protein NE237_007833 [Protea cynaroides]